MSNEINPVSSLNIGSNSDNPITVNEILPIIGNTKKGKVEKPIDPTPQHYFDLAKTLIYITLVIMGVLGYIAVYYPSREHVATNIIQIFLYPFLTLMVGYVFGKGIPKKKKSYQNGFL